MPAVIHRRIDAATVISSTSRVPRRSDVCTICSDRVRSTLPGDEAHRNASMCTRLASIVRRWLKVLMNWDDLTVFRATAEELSFTRAARRLRLSVSAVSQRVKRLERAVGSPLLERTTTHVALTDAGREVLRGALTIEEQWQDTLTRIARLDRVEPETDEPIRIGFLRAGHRGPLWQRLLALTPQRRWEPRHYASLSRGFGELAAGDLDFFLWSVCHGEVVTPDLDLAGLHSVDIARERVWVSLSEQHPLADADRIAFADLAEFHWVGGTSQEERDLTTALCREFGAFEPTFVSEVDAYRQVMEVIRDSYAVDIGSPSAPPSSGVVLRRVQPAPWSRYALSWRDDEDLSSLAPRVLETLRFRYAEKTREWNPEHWTHIRAHRADYPGIVEVWDRRSS
jgi:DNA-binding transcriptional LysR family regulator